MYFFQNALQTLLGFVFLVLVSAGDESSETVIGCAKGYYCGCQGTMDCYYVTSPDSVCCQYECPKGYYCAGGSLVDNPASRPYPCAPGTYQDELGQSECKKCAKPETDQFYKKMIGSYSADDCSECKCKAASGSGSGSSSWSFKGDGCGKSSSGSGSASRRRASGSASASDSSRRRASEAASAEGAAAEDSSRRRASSASADSSDSDEASSDASADSSRRRASSAATEETAEAASAGTRRLRVWEPDESRRLAGSVSGSGSGSVTECYHIVAKSDGEDNAWIWILLLIGIMVTGLVMVYIIMTFGIAGKISAKIRGKKVVPEKGHGHGHGH